MTFEGTEEARFGGIRRWEATEEISLFSRRKMAYKWSNRQGRINRPFGGSKGKACRAEAGPGQLDRHADGDGLRAAVRAAIRTRRSGS